MKTTLPGASNLVITGKGELIAYPGFAEPGQASEKTVKTYEFEHELTSNGKQGEVAVEQAFLDFLLWRFLNLRAGMTIAS